MKILITVISLFFFTVVHSINIDYKAYNNKDSTEVEKEENKDTTQQLNFEPEIKLDPEFYKERYQEKDLMYPALWLVSLLLAIQLKSSVS